MKRLIGRVALVTGSSRGIGREIVIRLAEEGAIVAINYLSDKQEEEAIDVLKMVENRGSKGIIVKADVRRKSENIAMVETINNKFGNIDILVNNAGIAPFNPFLELNEEIWDDTFNTNVKSIFLLTQIIAPSMMKKRFGKIVTITSTASILVTSPVAPHYIASKAAAYQLNRALAVELGKYNINVNAVGPSTIDTDLTREYLNNKETTSKEIAVNPMKRLGTAKNIADSVVFLCSDESEQINGHLLMVDGGLTAKTAQPQPEEYMFDKGEKYV